MDTRHRLNIYVLKARNFSLCCSTLLEKGKNKRFPFLSSIFLPRPDGSDDQMATKRRMRCWWPVLFWPPDKKVRLMYATRTGQYSSSYTEMLRHRLSVEKIISTSFTLTLDIYRFAYVISNIESYILQRVESKCPACWVCWSLASFLLASPVRQCQLAVIQFD